MNGVFSTITSTKTDNTMEIEVKIKSLTHEELSDILSTAFYDNPNMSVGPGEGCKPSIDHHCYEDNLAQILLDGGHIEVTDLEADTDEVYGDLEHCISPDEYVFYKVTLKDILEKASTPECFRMIQDILSGEGDMITAWNLMQTIVFGEIIYG